jgi:cob(I)alamin adenosyltransferase
MGKGGVQVITGDGKGKTTAALGLAWKAVLEGRKVFMVQFLKSPDSSGEHFAAPAYSPLLTIKPMGRKGFIRRRGGDPRDADLARSALEEARKAVFSEDYDIVILDEINIAIYMELIEPEAVAELVRSKPAKVGVVLTGRNAHPKILQSADSIIEMRKIKHPYDNGIPALEGIEY